MFWLLSLAVLATPLLGFLSTLVRNRIRSSRSPLRKLPGPQSQSWLYGNIKDVFEKGQTVAWDGWMATYGKTFRYTDVFNVHPFTRYFQPDTNFMLSRPFPSLPQTLGRSIMSSHTLMNSRNLQIPKLPSNSWGKVRIRVVVLNPGLPFTGCLPSKV